MKQITGRRDRIAARAYQTWQEEGRPENRAEEHWLRAEQEVCREASGQKMDPDLEEPSSQHASAEAPRQQSKTTTPGILEDASQSQESGGCCGGRRMRGRGRHRPRSA